MTKILKQGNKNNCLLPIITFHCTICGTIFEADRESYKEYSTTIDKGFKEYYHYNGYKCLCPCCNSDCFS